MHIRTHIRRIVHIHYGFQLTFLKSLEVSTLGKTNAKEIATGNDFRPAELALKNTWTSCMILWRKWRYGLSGFQLLLAGWCDGPNFQVCIEYHWITYLAHWFMKFSLTQTVAGGVVGAWLTPRFLCVEDGALRRSSTGCHPAVHRLAWHQNRRKSMSHGCTAFRRFLYTRGPENPPITVWWMYDVSYCFTHNRWESCVYMPFSP